MAENDLSPHTAKEVIRLLDLEPHPEGGWFRETFRNEREADSGRAFSTAIYFLLAAGEVSRWHRVDAAEIWHYYAGAPLLLALSPNGREMSEVRLGLPSTLGQRPQAVVPARSWQAARSLGSWTLVGCTVSPGFTFTGFEMAPKGWEPTSMAP